VADFVTSFSQIPPNDPPGATGSADVSISQTQANSSCVNGHGSSLISPFLADAVQVSIEDARTKTCKHARLAK
jgi:hypothetical protein